MVQSGGSVAWLFGVSFIDDNTGTAVGNCGTVLRTTNGGATWSSQQSNTESALRAASFPIEDNGTIVGDDGAVLRTTTGGVISSVRTIVNKATNRQAELRRNVPNPASDRTTIRFDLTQPDHVVIDVTDALGGTIAVLVNEYLQFGTHEVLFDTRNVHVGAYNYCLRVACAVESRRLIVVR